MIGRLLTITCGKLSGRSHFFIKNKTIGSFIWLPKSLYGFVKDSYQYILDFIFFIKNTPTTTLVQISYNYIKNIRFRDNTKIRYWAYDLVAWKAHFLKKYLYTINHKRIALNYLYFSIISGLAGALLASFIRLELAYPGSHFFKGDSVRYIQVISSHGLVMIFYVVIPIVFGLFANYFIPFHILAKDVSFPRLNSIGFWLLPAGFFLMSKPAFSRRQVYKFWDPYEAYKSVKENILEDFMEIMMSDDYRLLKKKNGLDYEDINTIFTKKYFNQPSAEDYLNLIIKSKPMPEKIRSGIIEVASRGPVTKKFLDNLLGSYLMRVPEPMIFDAGIINTRAQLNSAMINDNPLRWDNGICYVGIEIYPLKHLGRLYMRVLRSAVPLVRTRIRNEVSSGVISGLLDDLRSVMLTNALSSDYKNEIIQSNDTLAAAVQGRIAKKEGNRMEMLQNWTDFLLLWEHNHQWYENPWQTLRHALRNKTIVMRNEKCSSPTSVMSGWTFITPFSSQLRYTGAGAQDAATLSVVFAGISSTVSFTNLLITRRVLSAAGFRNRKNIIPFISISLFLVMRMLALITPVLGAAMLMLMLDRHWRTSFFDYAYGGDSVLFHHLFWFFGHPEVYVVIIPAFGIVNSFLPFYNRRRIASKNHLVWATYVMAYMGFLVWGHHMYLVGLDHRSRSLYSTITVMISLPAVVKIVNWTLTFLNGVTNVDISLYFIVSFLTFFLSGGLTGLWLSHVGLNIFVHDTFYVVAHFHFMFSCATFSAIFAGFYFFYKEFFGVEPSKPVSSTHYVYWTIGQWVTFTPLYWVGYNGLPRRYHDYPVMYMGWHGMSTAGHLVTMIGISVFFFGILESKLRKNGIIPSSHGVPRTFKRVQYYLLKISKLQTIGNNSYRADSSHIDVKPSN